MIRAVCIHHTDRPSEADWTAKGGWAYWEGVLRRFYQMRGWTAMPHVFAAPDGWHVLWPLDQDGRGVGGGSLEPGLRHVEIVGNYNERLPVGATLNNAVDAAAAILLLGGLGPEAMTNHTAVVGPGVTECPGAMLLASWTWFTELVATRWWERKMDAQAEATAVRFELEEIVRLRQKARQHRDNAVAEQAMAEWCERQANMREEALVSTKNGRAYRVEGLLGGPLPADWEG